MSGALAERGRAVFLVGFMGSGKSAVGEILAAQLGWEFADTDARVEQALGRPVETIFREAGEGRFREAEWRVLQELGGDVPRVVATGGGLYLGVVQRKFMREQGMSVWLDVPLEEIRRRIGSGPGRPLWAAGDRVAQRAFFEKRRAAYALADLRVPAGDRDPAQIAVLVRARLDALPLIFPREK